MHVEPHEASGLERLCASLAARRSRPIAILGCSYPFQGSIFSEVLDNVAKALQLDDTDLARIPIDVICDRNLYRGRAPDGRYQVHLYPGTELFHPKLLLVLLQDEVIWLSGSGNLTRAGYCFNREIALLHEPEQLNLPAPLRQLLARLPGDAARVIRGATVDARSGTLSTGRFVSSLDGPIGTKFLSRAPRGVEEVHVVAPFFENLGSDDSIDTGWLEALRSRFPGAAYRFYLPRTEPGKKPCVQGDRALFLRFIETLGTDSSVLFYPVPPDPGPLHGKLVAITYRSSQGRRARLLVGSPNPSRRALLTPRRNVEVAWIVDIKARALDAFLECLEAGTGRGIDSLRFEKPARDSSEVWSALSRAVLDPRSRTLSLSWIDGHGRGDTDVLYGRRLLDVRPDDRVHDFELDATEGDLKTRPRTPKSTAGRTIPGHCPIEVPLADQMLLDAVVDDMSPEDWLSLWGRDPGEGAARGGVGAAGRTSHGAKRNADAFAPSDRVRDLAARIRYTLEQFRAPFWSEAERDATLLVLVGTFDSHDPGLRGLEVSERVWRGWVRAELIQFVGSASRDRGVRDQGLAPMLKDLARGLGGRIELHSLPRAVRKQLRLVARGQG